MFCAVRFASVLLSSLLFDSVKFSCVLFFCVPFRSILLISELEQPHPFVSFLNFLIVESTTKELYLDKDPSIVIRNLSLMKQDL